MKNIYLSVIAISFLLALSVHAVTMDGTLVSADETSIIIKNKDGKKVTFTTDKKSPYISVKHITIHEVPSGSPIGYRGKADVEKNEVTVKKIIFKDPASKNFKTSINHWGGSGYLQRDGEKFKLEAEEKILDVKPDPQKGIEVVLQTDGKKFNDVKPGIKVKVEYPKKDDFSRIYRVYYYENSPDDVKRSEFAKPQPKEKPQKKSKSKKSHKPESKPQKTPEPKSIPKITPKPATGKTDIDIKITPINTGHTD